MYFKVWIMFDLTFIMYKHKPRKHLLRDGVVTSVYMNTCLRSTATIPGYATKKVEDMNFYADRAQRRRRPSHMDVTAIVTPYATLVRTE
jgi:hypothetical protein